MRSAADRRRVGRPHVGQKSVERGHMHPEHPASANPSGGELASVDQVADRPRGDLEKVRHLIKCQQLVLHHRALVGLLLSHVTYFGSSSERRYFHGNRAPVPTVSLPSMTYGAA